MSMTQPGSPAGSRIQGALRLRHSSDHPADHVLWSSPARTARFVVSLAGRPTPTQRPGGFWPFPRRDQSTQQRVPGRRHRPQKVIPPVNAIRLRCFREIVYNTIIGNVPTNAALNMGPMRNR